MSSNNMHLVILRCSKGQCICVSANMTLHNQVHIQAGSSAPTAGTLMSVTVCQQRPTTLFHLRHLYSLRPQFSPNHRNGMRVVCLQSSVVVSRPFFLSVSFLLSADGVLAFRQGTCIWSQTFATQCPHQRSPITVFSTNLPVNSASLFVTIHSFSHHCIC